MQGCECNVNLGLYLRGMENPVSLQQDHIKGFNYFPTLYKKQVCCLEDFSLIYNIKISVVKKKTWWNYYDGKYKPL